jgi:hypothetical protein
MTLADLNTIARTAKEKIHIVTSSVAYAVAAIEQDKKPRFQLGTAIQMGLSNEEIANPSVIARMRWEYRAWIIGHGLADISESIATLLNELVMAQLKSFGYKDQYKKFERLGLDLKVKALPALNLDADYLLAIESLTRARNCLIHRHGVVAQTDCNSGNEFLLRWRGFRLFKVTPEGPVEFDPAHRGPATQVPGDMVKLEVARIERRFGLGARLDLQPNDLCTISLCLQYITDAIHKNAERLLT